MVCIAYCHFYNVLSPLFMPSYSALPRKDSPPAGSERGILYLRDFRLSPRSSWELRSSALLRVEVALNWHNCLFCRLSLNWFVLYSVQAFIVKWIHCVHASYLVRSVSSHLFWNASSLLKFVLAACVCLVMTDWGFINCWGQVDVDVDAGGLT